MNVTLRFAILSVCILWNWQPVDAAPKNPITISKKTTHFTGPLTRDGFLDYAGAINRRLGEDVNSASNANVVFWKALGGKTRQEVEPEFFKLLGIDADPHGSVSYVDFEKFLQTLKPAQSVVAAREQKEQATQRPWTSRQFPLVTKWLKVNQASLAVIVEGTRRPRYFSPLVIPRGGKQPAEQTLVAVSLPELRHMRIWARALVARALWHSGEGRSGAAWQDLVACHRLGRLVGQGPTLIHILVGYAIEAIAIRAELTFLQHVNSSAKAIAGYRKDLASLPRFSTTSSVIDLGERCMFLDVTQRVAGAEAAGFGDLFGSGDKRDAMLLKLSAQGIDWDVVMQFGNRWYDRMATAQRVKDRSGRRAALKQIDGDLKRLSESVKTLAMTKRLPKSRKAISETVGAVLVSLMFPAATNIQNANEQAVQRFRNLETALALLDYHHKHDEYPDSLRQLVPGFLKQVPADIFSGKAVLYRKDKRSCLFFSVGINGKDERGRGREEKQPGDDLKVHLTRPGKN